MKKHYFFGEDGQYITNLFTKRTIDKTNLIYFFVEGDSLMIEIGNNNKIEFFCINENYKNIFNETDKKRLIDAAYEEFYNLVMGKNTLHDEEVQKANDIILKEIKEINDSYKRL